MAFRNKWIILPFAFALFGLLSLSRRSIFPSESGIRIRGLREIDDSRVIDKPIKYASAEEGYKKEFVQIFSGTLFFNMPVTNERFLGHCSVKDQCRIVDDINSADAVVFHGPDYNRLIPMRPKQIAVLWFLESPISYTLERPFFERINWTMTYRRDSDVPLPYGVFKKRIKPVAVDFDAIWKAKNSSVIWLISNCAYRNGRLKLADAMRLEGLQIDIYGLCGGRKTPNNCDGVNKQSDECVAELFRPYKFAISFENSLCKDYITEKFFEVLQKRFAVPIVMQRKRYENIGAPAYSFIAVDDFDSVKDLVEYLHQIEKSKEDYLAYHKWREDYTVESDYFSIEDTGFCALCKKIMKQDFSTKYYRDPKSWHVTGTCEEPQDQFVKGYLGNMLGG